MSELQCSTYWCSARKRKDCIKCPSHRNKNTPFPSLSTTMTASREGLGVWPHNRTILKTRWRHWNKSRASKIKQSIFYILSLFWHKTLILHADCWLLYSAVFVFFPTIQCIMRCGRACVRMVYMYMLATVRTEAVFKQMTLYWYRLTILALTFKTLVGPIRDSTPALSRRTHLNSRLPLTDVHTLRNYIYTYMGFTSSSTYTYHCQWCWYLLCNWKQSKYCLYDMEQERARVTLWPKNALTVHLYIGIAIRLLVG